MAPSHCLNPYWNIVNWTLRNKLQWKFNQNANLFICKIASERYRLRNGGHFVSSSMCKMSLVLRRWWVITTCLLFPFSQSMTASHAFIIGQHNHFISTARPRVRNATDPITDWIPAWQANRAVSEGTGCDFLLILKQYWKVSYENCSHVLRSIPYPVFPTILMLSLW